MSEPKNQNRSRRGRDLLALLVALLIFACSSPGQSLATQVCDCYEAAQADSAKRKTCGTLMMKGQTKLTREDYEDLMRGLMRCKDALSLGPG